MSDDAIKAKLTVVVPFPERERPETVDETLDVAREAGLARVVVIGEQADGTLWFSSSCRRRAEVLWLVEVAKLDLLDCVQGGK